VKVASVGPLSVAEVEADPTKFPYEEILTLWSAKDGAVSNRHSQRTALAKLLRLSDSMFAVQIRNISSGECMCAKLIYCIVLCVCLLRCNISTRYQRDVTASGLYVQPPAIRTGYWAESNSDPSTLADY